MKNTALLVAGLIFLLVALAHLLRLVFSVEIMIAGTVIPQNLSIVASIVALILAIWMFRARSARQ